MFKIRVCKHCGKTIPKSNTLKYDNCPYCNKENWEDWIWVGG